MMTPRAGRSLRWLAVVAAVGFWSGDALAADKPLFTIGRYEVHSDLKRPIQLTAKARAARDLRRVQVFVDRIRSLRPDEKAELLSNVVPAFADPARAPNVEVKGDHGFGLVGAIKRWFRGGPSALVIGANGSAALDVVSLPRDRTFRGEVAFAMAEADTDPANRVKWRDSWDGAPLKATDKLSEQYLANRLFVAASDPRVQKVLERSKLFGLSTMAGLATALRSHMDGADLELSMWIDAPGRNGQLFAGPAAGGASDVPLTASGQAIGTYRPNSASDATSKHTDINDASARVMVTTQLRWRSAVNMAAAVAQDVIFRTPYNAGVSYPRSQSMVSENGSVILRKNPGGLISPIGGPATTILPAYGD